MPRSKPVIDYNTPASPKRRSLADWLFDAFVIFGLMLLALLVGLIVWAATAFGGR